MNWIWDEGEISGESDSQGVDVRSHLKLGTRSPLPGWVAWLQIARADFTYFKKGRGREASGGVSHSA